MSNDIDTANSANISAAAVQMADEAETPQPAAGEIAPATPETPAAGSGTPAETKTPAEDGNNAPAETKEPAEDGNNAPAETKEPAEDGNPPPAKKSAGRRIVMKILKWTGIFFGALLLLLILVLLFRDSIIKAILPKYLSSTLGVKVAVADIDTSLFKGKLQVKGVTVANPEGYSEDKKALALDELYVKIDVGSLFTKKIVIEEIRLTGLAVNVESHKLFDLLNEKECNLTAIVEGYKRRNPPKKKKEPSEDEKSKTKVVVRLLKIEKLSVSLKIEDIAFEKTLENISIEEKNLGEEKEDKSWREDLKERVLKIWNYFKDDLKNDLKDSVDVFFKTLTPPGLSAVTGVEVMVADVDVSPDGTLRITGVQVANPEGYGKDKKAIELKELYVKVDRDSLLSEKIVIEELRLDGLAVNVEANDGIRMQDEMECNLKTICDNVRRNLTPAEKKTPSAANGGADTNWNAGKKNKPQVVIRLFKVDNSSVSLRVKDMNIDQTLAISIEERDLGGENNSFEERGKLIVADHIARLTTARNSGGDKARRSARNAGFKFKRRKKKQ